MVDNTTMIELVDEISPILERLARRRRRSDGNSNTITYGNLASEVGPKVGIRNLPPNDKRLERALDEISMRSFRRHEILLSVLVVRADTRMPGRGFFELAKRRIAEQGLTNPYPAHLDNFEVFRDACDQVHEHYRRRENPSAGQSR
jgi:hypothetical protein